MFKNKIKKIEVIQVNDSEFCIIKRTLFGVRFYSTCNYDPDKTYSSLYSFCITEHKSVADDIYNRLTIKDQLKKRGTEVEP